MIAVGEDLEGIPFADGIRLVRQRRFQVVDAAGRPHRMRVEDVRFVAGHRAGRALAAAEKDAAVRRLVDPELGLELEVAVGPWGDEISRPLGRGDRPVLHLPVDIAGRRPARQRASVE